MVNLLSTYENYKIEHQKFYLLGHKTPHKLNNLNNDEIIDLFLYTYSFLGLNILELMNLNKVKTILLDELIKFDTSTDTTTNYKKWWLLSLVYFKYGAEHHNLKFISSLCDTLKDKIHELNEKDLVNYCNVINDSLSDLIGFDLRIRPSVDKNPNVYIYPIYRDLTLHSKNIISILKHNLCLDEINNEDINHEFALISEIGYNYNHWSVIFDILLGQILIQIDKPSFSTNHDDNLINAIDLSLLNLYIDTEFIPDNLIEVRNEIINILNNPS